MVRRLPFVADQSLHLPEELSDPILVGSEAWYCWLAAEQHPSFAFISQLGTFTVRRERRRQQWYWYLYHKQEGKLRKAYLGKAEEMTLQRLNAVTATVVAQGGLHADAHMLAPRSPLDGSDHPLPTPLHPRASFPGSGHAPPHNLPAQLTPLIGREQEVAAVCTLLRRPEVRLVTLTGTGGIGKTRLAIQVATEVLADFADGVFLVSLAFLSDPALVPSTIAQILNVKESGTRPFSDLLIAFLRDKHLLLCLDNFEHLLEASPQMTDLLSACPHLSMLVTSRAVLHLQGEHVFPVPPLAVPDLTQLPPTDTLPDYAAVALFLQRAQAVQPTFQLTSTNTHPTAELCIRLDGLPLAIELAAARIPLFPPQALLARLTQRLHLLTSGTRDVPARQQTLRNTIAWSYHLLAQEEQRLFRRLAVFVGGCPLQAAEAVCEALGEGAGKVVEAVASVIDKSLVYQTEQEGEEEPRLLMLETIREYALEVLSASGELEATRQAHASYYLRMAEQAEAELEGPQQVRWLKRLEREHDNLRAALTWALSPESDQEDEHRRELAWRLGGALGQFWIRCSQLHEGRTFLEQALAIRLPAVSPLRAKVLSVAADLAMVQSDMQRAEMLAEEGLALSRQLADQTRIAYCLFVLGVCALGTGRDEDGQARAYACLEESASLFRMLGNKARLGGALLFLGLRDRTLGKDAGARAHFEEALVLFNDLGYVYERALIHFLLGLLLFYSQGDALTAHERLQEASRLWREQGNTLGLAVCLLRSAEVALLGQGNLAAAEAQAEEALGLFSGMSYKAGMAEVLFVLARMQARQGNYAAARSRYADILTLAREGDDVGNIHAAFRVEHDRDLPGRPSENDANLNIPFYLEGLAQVVAAQGEGARAARLWGAAQALREGLHAPLPVVFRTEHEQAIAATRTQIGEKAFAAALSEGRTMSLEQVLATKGTAEILAIIPTERSLTPSVQIPFAFPAGLTPREMEVLRLLSQGLTSAQIAEQLVISVVTVNFHVRSIYNKLGVSSRSAATRYAIEHHLV
ncbi:MAG TPA: LuxR C-terminal-related transcriptional regulator [Ktedonobacteraceae bacterium]|nr:LuxR C-terminal-related transcriptional regulator [Ktedonobacteraceae bacterium]